MPLPMVHLAVAVRLYAIMSDGRTSPSPAFLLGSIAPDAIHMRPGTVRTDKHFTHLNLQDRKPFLEPIERFFRERVSAETTPSETEFVLGYCAHLMTDALWLTSVYDDFKEKGLRLVPDDQLRKLYYLETDKNDFLLYRQPWRPGIWDRLEHAAAPELQPYLSAEEIEGWMRRTLRWFENPDKEPSREPELITFPLTLAFIEEAAQYIAKACGDWFASNPKAV